MGPGTVPERFPAASRRSTVRRHVTNRTVNLPTATVIALPAHAICHLGTEVGTPLGRRSADGRLMSSILVKVHRISKHARHSKCPILQNHQNPHVLVAFLIHPMLQKYPMFPKHVVRSRWTVGSPRVGCAEFAIGKELSNHATRSREKSSFRLGVGRAKLAAIGRLPNSSAITPDRSDRAAVIRSGSRLHNVGQVGRLLRIDPRVRITAPPTALSGGNDPPLGHRYGPTGDRLAAHDLRTDDSTAAAVALGPGAGRTNKGASR